MITLTAKMATTANAIASEKFGAAQNAPRAPGARLTMPAKMMKLMPLPMPRSVMSSPSHIRTTAPAVRVAIWVRVVKLDRSNEPVSTFCEASSARTPYACRIAIGTVR